jgi:hypothetical protein
MSWATYDGPKLGAHRGRVSFNSRPGYITVHPFGAVAHSRGGAAAHSAEFLAGLKRIRTLARA